MLPLPQMYFAYTSKMVVIVHFCKIILSTLDFNFQSFLALMTVTGLLCPLLYFELLSHKTGLHNHKISPDHSRSQKLSTRLLRICSFCWVWLWHKFAGTKRYLGSIVYFPTIYSLRIIQNWRFSCHITRNTLHNKNNSSFFAFTWNPFIYFRNCK